MLLRAHLRGVLLVVLCTVAHAALTQDSAADSAPAEQLESEFRQLMTDAGGLASSPAASILQKRLDAMAVVGRTVELWNKMGPNGPYEKAAMDLMLRKHGKSALRATCDEVKQDIGTKMSALGGFDPSATGDCTLKSFEELVTQGMASLGSSIDEATINSVQAKVEKECSFTGPQTATSCGEKSPMSIMGGLFRKYQNEQSITAASCQLDGEPVKNIIFGIGMYVDTICLKEGNTYCLGKVARYGGLSAMQNTMKNPDKASLDTMCDPCVRKFVKKVFIGMAMAFETTGEDASSTIKIIEVLFDLTCSKDLDGGYCLLDPDITKMVNDDPAQMATWICNEGGCGNKYLDAMVQVMSMGADNAEDKAKIALYKIIMASGCFKNKDKYCMQYPQEGNVWDNVVAECGYNQDPFAAVPATKGETCSAGCSTAFETMSSTWGCCAMTMGATVSKEFNTALEKQSASCSVSMPGMCSGGKPLAFNIKVSNLDWTWYEASASTANKDVVTGLVQTVIFETYGVKKRLVTVTGTKMEDGGTELTINMEFETDAQSAAVKKAHEANYPSARRAAQKLSFEEFEKLPASARRDPEAQMAVTVVTGEMKSGETVISAAAASGGASVRLSLVLAAFMLFIGSF
jgi:hypothetical protein